MKQILRAAAVGTALLAAASVGGCSTGGSGGGTGGGTGSALGSCLAPNAPVAIGIGARSNNPQPTMTDTVKAAMNSAINAKQQVTIIRLDGDPKVVYSEAYAPTGANTQAQKSDYNAYVNELNEILAGTSATNTDVRAQVPQANLLEALAIAADEAGTGGNVVIMDAGLQTTSPLDFTTGLLADDPQDIASSLKSSNELPDLKGRHVEFSGLGWTAAPQQQLSIANRTKVGEIWTDIAEAAGASCVDVDQTPNTNAAIAGLPAVSVVKQPVVQPLKVVPKCSVTNLDDSNNVGFDFNSTVFRDPAGADATLRVLAKAILSSGDSVTLTGATSSEGTDAYNTQLSLDRADKVKSVLMQMGVPASRITTHGDGAHLPGRLNDKGPNGQLLIGPAITNRKVVAKLSGTGCPTT